MCSLTIECVGFSVTYCFICVIIVCKCMYVCMHVCIFDKCVAIHYIICVIIVYIYICICLCNNPRKERLYWDTTNYNNNVSSDLAAVALLLGARKGRTVSGWDIVLNKVFLVCLGLLPSPTLSPLSPLPPPALPLAACLHVCVRMSLLPKR